MLSPAFRLLSCLAFTIIAASNPLPGQALKVKAGEKAAFKVLSIRDGLPNASVAGLVQDSKGFIWMATQGGLSRYDGSGFKSFANEPFDESSISSDMLQTIFLDKDDSLWIGSYNGLNHFYPATESFVHYRYSAEKESSLSNDLIIAVERDARGRLWVGTLNGLNRMDEGDGTFTRYYHDPANEHSIPNNTIRALFRDQAGRLWVGTTGGGFASYDYDNDRFDNYAQYTGNGSSVIKGAAGMAPATSMQSIAQDADGNLWLGAWGSGLLRFSPEEKSCEVYSLPDNRVYVVNAQEKRGVCVGTWGGGLFVLDPEARTVESYKTSSSLGSLPNDVAYSILRDASGELWVGTNGGGVARMDRTRRSFTAYVANPNDPKALPSGKIHSIIVDAGGSLWAAVYGGGIQRYEPATDSWRHFRHSDSDPTSIGDDICNWIYEDRRGTLWAATNNGLSRFEPGREAFATLRHDEKNPNSLGSSIVTAVLEDKGGNLWIGTYTAGLDYWNRGTGVWTHYPYDPKDPSSISDNLVNCLGYDASGKLWVGTNNGLNRFENGEPGMKGRFVRYVYDPNNEEGVSSNSIQRIYLDSKGILWISTRGGGVMRYRREADKFTHFTRKDGLPNNIAYGILEDHSTNLWFVTQTGLARFDRQTGTIKRVALYKELENASFNTGSLVGPKGELYFGSVGLIARFNPYRYETNTHVPPVFVTDIIAANKEKITAPLASTRQPLRFAHWENSVEFRFAALDFRDPSANQFVFKLEGFDKDWRYLPDRNYATYTNLPGGHYTFKVKAANNDGLWNEEGASIAIKMDSSPFLGPIAIALYLIVIAAAGYLLATARANRSLALKVRELSATQVALEAASQDSKRLAEEAEAANLAKSDFISTVSHEVRTPINGVIGMIDLLSRTKLDDRQADYVATIKRSGEVLLGVINEVLDFSKLEADKVELEDRAFGPRFLLERTIAPFSPQAAAKGIALELSVAKDLPAALRGDSFRLGQVIANLVANAVKFTDKGRVRIGLGADGRRGDGAYNVVLEVSDTGIGIPADKLSTLFEPFSQADKSTTRRYGGTGLGLAICKRLVERMGGSIEARSVVGSGSSFLVRLALHDAPASPNPIAPQGSDQEFRASVPATVRSVLVVDDDPVNRRVAAALLGEMGIEAIEAESGHAAIALMGKIRPDLVLMDCSMPGMDGYETTRRIRDKASGVLDSETPIVAMTAHAQNSDRSHALEVGMDGYVAKPITQASLAAALAGVEARSSIALAAPKSAEAEAFDATLFDARYAKSKDIGREILQLFLAQTPPILEEAKAAAAAGDAKALEASVHRLKGTCGAVGGLRAAKAAELLLGLAVGAVSQSGSPTASLAGAFTEPMADLDREISLLIEAIRGYLERGALSAAAR